MITLKEREIAVAKQLVDAGIMCDAPGTGHPQSDVFNCWSVCVGSHGGHAKRIDAAMRRCLKCCGIGRWWQVSPPENTELLHGLFTRVLRDNHYKVR